MAIESMPTFSAPAAKRWKAIPEKLRKMLICNVWCSHCSKGTTITNIAGSLKDGTLLLEGECEVCHGRVARVVE